MKHLIRDLVLRAKRRSLTSGKLEAICVYAPDGLTLIGFAHSDGTFTGTQAQDRSVWPRFIGSGFGFPVDVRQKMAFYAKTDRAGA